MALIEEAKLPEGVTKEMLRHNWDTAQTEYARLRKKMIALDAIDRGLLWEMLCSKFPEFKISPDTNHVNYIKENIMANVYSVGKSATLIPASPDDEPVIQTLNRVLDNIWDILSVPFYQQKAGERAALLNYGVTQVGWNSDIVGGTEGYFYEGDVVLKHIDPLKFYRDPFADRLEDSGYCIFFDRIHKTLLRSNKNYKKVLDAVDKYNELSVGEEVPQYKDSSKSRSTSDKNYEQLVIHWVRVPDDSKEGFHISEIHTLDNRYILYVVDDLKPKMFPFAELYCNIPSSDPIGVSEPAKILNSSITVNLLDGLMASHAYKAQRPPRLISSQAGLNLRTFAKYGNDPDKAFIIHGKASDAVQYIQFPPLPNEIGNVVTRIDQNIKVMSGVDEKYTGKDTGSITTTGGIESLMAQATARDVIKINNYEHYSKSLTRLVINYLIEYADKRTYAVKNSVNGTFTAIEVDFPNIDSSINMAYSLHIGDQLPKSKARQSQAADAIMEKSMQYAQTGQPELMTVEEWISFKDFPQKDLMLARMAIQRNNNKTEEITTALFMFADLIQQGMPADQALNQTVMALEQQSNPNLGNVGNNPSGLAAGGMANSPQKFQKG